jgi:hypothetical protein
MKTKLTSFRMTPLGHSMLQQIANVMGIGRSAALEIAIRMYAREVGIKQIRMEESGDEDQAQAQVADGGKAIPVTHSDRRRSQPGAGGGSVPANPAGAGENSRRRSKGAQR